MCKHIALILPNKPGEFYGVSQELTQAEINVLGYSLLSEGRTGMLYLLCSPFRKAQQVLENRYKFYCTVKEVLVVKAENSPGQLEKILTILSNSDLNLNISYQASLPDNETAIVLELDSENKTEKAESLMIQNGFECIQKSP